MFLMYVSVGFATVVPDDNGPHGQPWKHDTDNGNDDDYNHYSK